MVAPVTGPAPTTLAVTGGTGFVGRMVLDRAAASQWQVRALARREPPALPGVEWVRGDLESPTALMQLVAGASSLIHIAGLTKATKPAAFHAANVLGTQAVLEAARAGGIRHFVFVSSLAARKPELSAYGRSKADGEQLVRASGVPFTIVRPPAVFGPRDTDMLELLRLGRRGIVPLPPPGKASLIDVRDLADLLLALAQTSGEGALYEPDDGADDGYTHRQLAGMIAAAVGRDTVFAPHLPGRLLKVAAGADMLIRRSHARLTADRAAYMTHPDWVVDSAARPPATLWQPRIPAVVGLAQTAQWYRAEGWL